MLKLDASSLKMRTVNHITYAAVILLATFVCLQFSVTFAAEKPQMALKRQTEILSKAVVAAETNRDLTVKAELLAKTVERQKADLVNKVVSSTLKIRMQQEIQNHCKPEILVPEFIKRMERIRAGSKGKVYLRSLLTRRSQGMVEAAGGAIAGMITVEGEPPDRKFAVFAFDDHGYFANLDSVDASTGEYLITDLATGSYYVLTWSNYFVDEIYDNQIAALGAMDTWRKAKKVGVLSGQETSGIDFDLRIGTLISGELTKTDGLPIVNKNVTFKITRSSSPDEVLTRHSYVQGKFYDPIRVPGNGKYKISAQVEGFIESWHPGVADWNKAEIITISAGDSIKEDINFILTPAQAGPEMGSIGGFLHDPEGGTDFGVIPLAAFNAVDTSFAGLGMALGRLLQGIIIMGNLKPGNYYVYANDITGGLLTARSDGESYLGIFYPSALSISEAETVPVVAGQTTIPSKEFILQQGGAISGRVTGPEGEALDSLLVLAFQKEGLNNQSDPGLTKLQLAFGITDSNGNYTLTGLPNGKYIVRTLSSLPLDSLNKTIGLDIFPRAKYVGKFVDEYFDDIKDIFDLEHATLVPVTIPNTTGGIDIQLDPVGFITGRVTAAEDGSPIDDILILALNDTSGIPALALGEIDTTSGFYILGPLPSGSYKVLAVSGLKTRHQHLTEFYDGARNFQDAAIVEVKAPLVTENKNFTLDRGAIIQGFVDLDLSAGAYPAGADTLDGVPVIVYDAASGKVASYDFVQFNGGYRIDRLSAGSYKVQVLPAIAPFASTYFGGGVVFDDPQNSSIEADFGDVADADIELGTANGSISGRIVDKNTQQPISMAMVIAYDTTGHPVGAAMSDFDFVTGNIISLDGSYTIAGLRSGTYYVRTFTLSALIPMLEGLVDFDPANLLTDPSDLFTLSIQAYTDKWYDDIQDVLIIDVNDLLIRLTSYGVPSERDQSLFPIFLPLPFHTLVPNQAMPVQVVDGTETSNINFELTIGSIEDIISTPVKDNISERQFPKEYALSQNYPNPFNPSTNFTYSLPQKDFVDLAIYDLLGRKVRTLVHRDVQAGTHIGSWDGLDEHGAVMPSGIYFVRFESGNQVLANKITLIR